MEEREQHRDIQFNATNTLWPFLKRLFGLARRNYPSYYWGLLFFVGLVAAADAYMPILWKEFIDGLVTPTFKLMQANAGSNWQEFINWDGLYWLAGKYTVWMIVMAIGVLGFIWFAEQIKERVIFDLRSMMFAKLQHLSFSFYDKNSSGWLVSRITSDADRVTELISWGFVQVIWGFTMIIVSFAFMFYLDWRLGFLVMATIPIILFVSVKIRLLVLEFSRKARRQNSDMIAYVTEHINGVEVNKATVQEENSIAGYGKMTKQMKHYAFRSSYYTAMYMPVVFLTGSIAASLVIYFGGSFHLIASSITLGAWAAFFGYSRLIFEPIFDISRFYAMAQDSLSAGERIFSLIDEQPRILEGTLSLDAQKVKGDIEFKNVDFSYLPEKKILSNFNIHLKPGESLALVGPTGHGKTTITALLGRFYEPTAGQLLLDGVDYKTIKLKDYRQQLGVILQEPHLFSGTVRDNILFGLRRAGNNGEIGVSDEEIKQVLFQIGADNLTQQLDSEVGESGANLSNGERQLVSFARAIIKNPAILIMDEATSSIDTLTEAKIQKGIAKMIENRTSIIIAHRLSTINKCDKIAVIENGNISELGNHTELMNQKGHYYDLYMNQKRAFEGVE